MKAASEVRRQYQGLIDDDRPVRSMRARSRLIPALVLLLLPVQLLFPNKGWMILLSGLSGAWLISYLWARSLMRGLRLEREMRFGWMQVGDQLQERITVVNEGWVPGLWVRVIDQSDMRGYQVSTVTDVRGGKHRNWYARGICRTRGLYTLGPTSLEAGDPLGIYQVRIDYHTSANMMVAPQVVSLPEIEIAAGGRIGEGSSPIRGIEQTVTAGGVREYLPGDSLRFVHWPTTARKQRPYVHLFDNEPSSDWWILLDMDPGVHIGEGPRSTEEYGVILAASLVNHGLQMDKAVGLIGQGQELVWHPPQSGDTQLWKILRSLAQIRAGGPRLGEVLSGIRGSLGQRVSLAIITPSLSPEWLNALELLKRSGIVPTVILLDPVSFGGFGNIQAIRDRLVRLGVAHYTVTADLLGPAELPQDDPREWWLVPVAGTRTSRAGRIGIRRWLQRSLRTWGLLLLLEFGLVTALANAIRGIEANLLWLASGAGLLVGWLLALSPLPGWALGALDGVIGLGLVMLRVGRLEAHVGRLLAQLRAAAMQIPAWVFQRAEPPDFAPPWSSLGELGERMSALASRLGSWASSALAGEAFFDPVLVAFLWGMMIWLTAVWATWAIFRRRQAMIGVLPSVGLAAISLAFLGTFSYDLVLMLGAALVLTVFIRHDVLEIDWERSQLFFDATIRPKVVAAGIGLALAMMTLAVVSPSISIESIKDLINQIGQGPGSDSPLARSIGLDLQSTPGAIDVLQARREGRLPNRHLLGSGPELSEEVVMTVAVEGLDTLGAAEGIGPLYLRSLIYDRYTGLGWSSRDTEILEYQAGDRTIPYWSENERLLRQRVTFHEDLGGLIFTLGTPVSADQDFRIAWRLKDDSAGRFDFLGGTIKANSYLADSLVPNYTRDELRNAGQAYPGWIRSRYLSLPSSVPERVLTLARDLTATEPTPYDRALVIERYLRQIPYTLDVSTPPVDVDVTEYFLFTLQQGYCDYYATAMVVLARAAGLPARLVTGYVAEHYDEDRRAYIVTADEAHAWPELYFPGIGWIPFEPTAGRSAIERPQERTPEFPSPALPELRPAGGQPGERPARWTGVLRPVGLALIGLAALALLIRDLLLFFTPAEQLIPGLYRRIYRYGRWIGLTIRPGQTPYEFQAALNLKLRSLARDCYCERWLLAGMPHLGVLTENLMDLMFKLRGKEHKNGREMSWAYLGLRPRLWMLMLLTRAYRYSILWSFFWKQAPIYASLSIAETE